MEIKLQKPSRKLILPGVSVLAIVAAILVVTFNFQTQGTLRKMLVAKVDIAIGEPLTSENTALQEFAITNNQYLNKLREGSVSTQTILKGQLIPSQSVTKVTDQRTPIRFNGLQTISEQLSVGDHVDIWATPNDRQGSGGAEVVAFDAIVTKVITTNNLSMTQTSVEVRINPDYLVSVLEAKANSLAIDLVLTETLADQE